MKSDRKPYKIPEGYLPWNKFEKLIMDIEACSILGLTDSGLQAIAEELKIWQQGYPLYCVRSCLLEDMQRTDVGERLELFADINLAVPCYALFFPQNKIKSPSKQGSISYLIVRHESLINSPEHKHLISWSCLDSGKQAIFGQKAIRKDGTLKRSRFATDDVEQQQLALDLRNLVLQSILLLQYYPEIAEKTYTPSVKGFGQKSSEGNSFLLPRWLGEERANGTKSGGGVGAEKSPHFRRGHYRKLEDRVAWVRPAWVNKT